MSGLRERLLQAARPRTRVVEVPELGTSLTVRELTAGEYERWARAHDELRDKGLLHAALVVAGVVDESGARVFGEEDLEAVAAWPASAVLRVARAVVELSELDGRAGNG